MRVFAAFYSILSIFLSGHVFCSVEGTFYPSDRSELSRLLDSLVKPAEKGVMKNIYGILVPHAGYAYSGRIAGLAYGSIEGEFDTVLILAPSHYKYSSRAVLFPEKSFSTPLGEIKVDTGLEKKLASVKDIFCESEEAFSQEHAIKTQFPFLTKKFGNSIKVLPILISSDDAKTAEKTALAIFSAVKKKKTLIVISSDLAHYPSHEDALRINEIMLRAILPMDAGFLKATADFIMKKSVAGLVTTACGLGAIETGIEILRLGGNKKTVQIAASNSWLENKDSDSLRTVGYVALAFYGGGEKSLYMLSENEKKELIKIARSAIEYRFTGVKPSAPVSALFSLPVPVFVTLNLYGRLRGCVGFTYGYMSLGEGVANAAEMAAFEDKRFEPLSKQEAENVKIEISLLGAPRRIGSWLQATEGKGVLIRNGENSGLFLPEVWKKIPERNKFFENLCSQKAGLEKECYKSAKTEIYIFETDVIEEDI
ncbi:MAG: AmmeMemoRadiSam system protein B [Elusimicrobiota bacterium]